jgi:hypothetical protein
MSGIRSQQNDKQINLVCLCNRIHKGSEVNDPQLWASPWMNHRGILFNERVKVTREGHAHSDAILKELIDIN